MSEKSDRMAFDMIVRPLLTRSINLLIEFRNGQTLTSLRIPWATPAPLTTKAPGELGSVPVGNSDSLPNSARLSTLSPQAIHPLLLGDWPRCRIRREWVQLIRTQAVTVTITPTDQEIVPLTAASLFTRAERAHYRLNWEQRLARNARSPDAPSITITIHGLPTSFAQSFARPLVA
jgi:hypothetical protein